ncbi:MAG: DEAD/DEAH box helicase [Roseibacillus sp.]
MADSFSRLARPIQEFLWEQKWPSLRPIQSKSIEHFSASTDDLIIAASTASGKTEAAFLPLLSDLCENPSGGISALCVAPLKALINDQFERISGIAAHADIQVHRWHGDVLASAKAKLRSKPSGVLLITPESLESCFINYGNKLPQMFGLTRYIVIDELHDFLGDVRGTHLSSLLSRVIEISTERPRHIGLSATLASFDSARAFLHPDSPDRVSLIQDEAGSNELKIGLRAFPKPNSRKPEKQEETPAYKKQPVDLLVDELSRVFRRHTNLIFTNQRALAELLTEGISAKAKAERWPQNPFAIHHGSLSKEVRESVEEELKKGKPLSVFCTSTLEMGIDIGSAYSVGQLGPTFSVASLVQRVGRSGRQEGASSILRMYSLDEPPTQASLPEDFLFPQLLQSIALIELMLKRWLEPTPNPNHHLSVFVQQVLSILRQTGGAEVTRIFRTLCTRGCFRTISQPDFTSILRELGKQEVIEQMPEGLLILTPKGEAITHDRDFYAAFKSSEDFSIRNQGKKIGLLPADTIPPEGEFLILNGRRWQVEVIESSSRTVDVIPGKGKKPPIFLGEPGSVHSKIREKMREVLRSENGYRYLHKDSQEQLSRARHYAAGKLKGNGSFASEKNACIVFPWSSSEVMRTLALCAKLASIPCEQRKISLHYKCTKDELETHFRTIAAGGFSSAEIAEILPNQHLEKYDTFLPSEILLRVNCSRAVPMAEATDCIRKILGEMVDYV